MKVVIAVVITFVFTALVAVGVIAALASGGKLKKSDPPVVTVQQPERGDLTECISGHGEVQPKTKLSISARVAARIARLPYEEGDKVTKGDPDANPPVPPSVLVQLDSAALEAGLASAEANRAASAAQIKVEEARAASQQAQVEGLKATLEQRRLDLERQRKLLDSRDVSQSVVEDREYGVRELEAQVLAAENSLRAAELNLTVLRHRLAAADAAIQQARDDLSYTTITSTIDGVITRLYAEEGEMVVPGTMNNPGTVIAEVADLSRMVLKAQVDETEVGRAQVGQKAVAHVHSCPDKPFEGAVETIALKPDIGQGGAKYFVTEIALDLGDRVVYPGSTADVDIHVKLHADVLKVPSQAVVERLVDELPAEAREKNPNVDATKTYASIVYRYVDAKAVATPVTIGASDETHTVIASGLSETDRVIVGPYKVLEDLKHDQTVVDEKDAPAKPKKAPKK